MDGEQILTEQIIGCALVVHKELGPGLLESTYEAALCIELAIRGLAFQRQLSIPLLYRGQPIGEYRLDLVVGSQVVVEIKSVARYDPVFAAQVLTYLKITGLRVGLLLNFGRPVLSDGIKRFVLNA
jgi:GxxExxY protein